MRWSSSMFISSLFLNYFRFVSSNKWGEALPCLSYRWHPCLSHLCFSNISDLFPPQTFTLSCRGGRFLERRRLEIPNSKSLSNHQHSQSHQNFHQHLHAELPTTLNYIKTATNIWMISKLSIYFSPSSSRWTSPHEMPQISAQGDRGLNQHHHHPPLIPHQDHHHLHHHHHQLWTVAVLSSTSWPTSTLELNSVSLAGCHCRWSLIPHHYHHQQNILYPTTIIMINKSCLQGLQSHWSRPSSTEVILFPIHL